MGGEVYGRGIYTVANLQGMRVLERGCFLVGEGVCRREEGFWDMLGSSRRG